jgi:hypothetical protein
VGVPPTETVVPLGTETVALAAGVDTEALPLGTETVALAAGVDTEALPLGTDTVALAPGSLTVAVPPGADTVTGLDPLPRDVPPEPLGWPAPPRVGVSVGVAWAGICCGDVAEPVLAALAGAPAAALPP